MKRHAFLIFLIFPLWGIIAWSGNPSRDKTFANGVCGYAEGDSILTVPSSVKRIPPFAFAECRSIKEVIFAEGAQLESIGEHAFLGCHSLENIALPIGVTSLEEGCFRDCTALRSIKVPDGVKKIPRFMCEWDEALQEVVLPSALKDIGSHAFAYCSSLTQIEIPPRVTHIGSNVFSYCTSLLEIILPDSVTELESYAFSECTSLRSARLPGNKSMLGELIFSGCRALQLLEEPSSTPPTFDCNSFIFEPDEIGMYHKCELKVPSGSQNVYRKAHGWNLFPNQTAFSL